MTASETRRASRVTRRRFCQVSGVSACALASAGAGALSIDFLRPRVLFEPPTRFTVGRPETLGVGTVITDEQHHVFIERVAGGYRALSSVCTHLGCITRYVPGENVIACPCHGSRFGLDGEVLEGPAPRPLRCLQMSLSDRGEIQVDTAVEVPQGTTFKL
jgi:cytochrome b6-f complex iron-sulfur subunit